MSDCGMGWLTALQKGAIAFAVGAAVAIAIIVIAAYAGDGGVDPWS